MSKQHKQHRHPNQGRTKPVRHALAPGRNDQRGGEKSRTNAVLFLVALVAVAGIVLYALDVSKRSKGRASTVPDTNLLQATVAVKQPTPSPPSSASGPKIQFATQIHDFGRIKGGEVVDYTYFFTNVGNQTLVISNVQVTCGCTTATEWSRSVEPGQTGTIPIQFNSTTFNGPVAKSINVTCNDASQPQVTLQLQATIWRTIEVTPQYAVLFVSAETPANTTTLRIVNNVDQPLTLYPPESGNPAFAAELKTNQPGREFELIVRTVPPLPAGNVSGTISLKTSSTNIPILAITAIANMQPVVMVMPSQLTLPTAPLLNPMLHNISIRNNGTNTLALTDPVINAKGVDVQMKELQPGRFFTLTVTFPVGFEIAQGETVELSVKSNHPQFPVIKVPVLQPPRPAPITAPDQGTRPPPSEANTPPK